MGVIHFIVRFTLRTAKETLGDWTANPLRPRRREVLYNAVFPSAATRFPRIPSRANAAIF